MTKKEVQKLKELRWKETITDLMQKLHKFHRCCMLRCTGFGKTWIVSELTKKYNQVIYVYPSEVIKETAENRIDVAHDNQMIATKLGLSYKGLEKVKFVSYAWLSLHFQDLKELNKLCKVADLIIFDECHLMGGPQCRYACEYLIENAKKADVVGATATIERSDNFDVIERFFLNVVTDRYTLHDAIQDKIIKRPIYCYCVHQGLDEEGNLRAITSDLLEAADKNGQDITNPKVKEVIKGRAIEIANIFNMPTVIKQVCKENKRTNRYMKFICFFSTVKQKNAKKVDVISWFQSAFPTKTINVLEIDSSCSTHSKNVNKLKTLHGDKNTIDLVFCVDMLNLGYHVDNLTGILMYRVTNSIRIYVQQLGRALSTGDGEACIVFDVMDNLHRKSLFADHKITSTPRNDNKEPRVKGEIATNVDGKVVGDYVMAPVDLERITPEAREELEQLLNLPDSEKEWKKHPVNELTSLDIVATSVDATYRELISKAVVEPEIMMCARFVEMIFRRWCMSKDITYPCSLDRLEKVYTDTDYDFKTAYLQFLHEDIDFIKAETSEEFPLFDAKRFMHMEDVCPVFAVKTMDILSKQVCNHTVREVLNYMDIPVTE